MGNLSVDEIDMNLKHYFNILHMLECSIITQPHGAPQFMLHKFNKFNNFMPILLRLFYAVCCIPLENWLHTG